MDRRKFLQVAGSSTVLASLATPIAADERVRDLVTHTVAQELSEITPLVVYSSLKDRRVTDQLLVYAHGDDADEVTVSVWDDWSDPDLHHVFAAFLVESRGEILGSYRIYDTPDIAFDATARRASKIESGYVDVEGMRANRIETGDQTTANLRLWNVVIGGVMLNDSSDVILGLVRHLGQSIGTTI